MGVHRGVLALTLCLVWVLPARAAGPEATTFAPNLELVDVPTASALYSRMFHLNFRAFRNGGIMLKGVASFNNSLMLGLAAQASNVIGEGNVVVDTDPPVRAVAKVKLVSLPEMRLQTAVGYDGMEYDITREKGLYGVASKDVSAGPLHLRVHGGTGVISFSNFATDDEHLNVFAGISAALSEDLFLALEYDDMLYDYGAGDPPADGDGVLDNVAAGKGSVNALVGYGWDVGLRIELDFKGLFRGIDRHYRMLKLLYTF